MAPGKASLLEGTLYPEPQGASPGIHDQAGDSGGTQPQSPRMTRGQECVPLAPKRAPVPTRGGRRERDDDEVCDVLNPSLRVRKTISEDGSHPPTLPSEEPSSAVRTKTTSFSVRSRGVSTSCCCR